MNVFCMYKYTGEFYSKKRMCYDAYTNMHNNAEGYMQCISILLVLIQRKECVTMHIQLCTIVKRSLCIIHTQAHTLHDNKSETNSPVDYLTYYATQLRPCGSHFQLSNTEEPASLLLLLN